MLYEYRRYEVNPGKKPELDARFRDLTMPLWEKHGMKAVGLFDVEVGTMTNEFHYILAWESLAERERIFPQFLADPEWVEGRAASEANGPLALRVHNQIWRPAPFSPLP
jgi:hypothetical protein